MNNNDIENLNNKINKTESQEKKIKSFTELLNNIKDLSDKKKVLWKEIYENAISDRENARILFSDAYQDMSGGINDHLNVGTVMSKYLERMCRSNDQILKLAELISKVDTESNKVTPDDIFSEIESKN